MDNNDLELYLKRYYNTLKAYGYIPYQVVFRLLVMLFIYQIESNANLSKYITEDDQRIIDKALSCIKNSSCIV
jgi:hypothetical protein